MSDMGISQVLDQMRAISAQARRDPVAESGNAAATGRPDFAGLLKESVNSVNEAQQAAGKLQAAFEAEDPNVDVAQVMVAMQKSSLSFQAMATVRNKLVAAYQEIMSMPV
ncbi:MAG: flagellar hook-basal body complex protein FliE [Gammaproteobacteria bacterium]